MVVGVECRDRKQRGELKGKEFQRLRYFLYTHFCRLSPKKKHHHSNLKNMSTDI